MAGNFFRTGYAGKTTDNILCYFTRCRDSFFPAKIEGVNTGETCGNVMEEEADKKEVLRRVIHLVGLRFYLCPLWRPSKWFIQVNLTQ